MELKGYYPEKWWLNFYKIIEKVSGIHIGVGDKSLIKNLFSKDSAVTNEINIIQRWLFDCGYKSKKLILLHEKQEKWEKEFTEYLFKRFEWIQEDL